jgi:hypothetical protein
MQKVCKAPGGVKAYRENPDCLVDPETLTCPFCPDGHRLWRHGWYERQALLPDPAPAVTIPIRRLICPVTGRTVSLLPDFCLPRRQHGPEILGGFLEAYLLRGMILLGALRSVRAEAAGHSVAQSLLRGFDRRTQGIQAYLAQRRPRRPRVPDGVPAPLRALAALILELRRGFRDIQAAFVHHGRVFHAFGRQGLA